MNEDDFQEIIRVQQLMSQRLMQEHKTDNKIDMLNLIQELSENGKKRVQVEALLIEAQLNNMTEREATQLLEELERDNLLRRPKVGWVELY